MTRSPRSRRGQALAELALALPLLLGVLVLTVEGTLMISSQHSLIDAVHQVARSATQTRMTPEQIESRLEAILANDPSVDTTAIRVDVSYGIDSSGSDNIQITATLPVRPMGFTEAGSFDISASATYRIPKKPTGGPVNPM